MRVAILVVCFLSLYTLGGQAQDATQALAIAPSRGNISAPSLRGPTMTARTFPFSPALQVGPAVPDTASIARQRLARQLLAAGIGFSLAAAVTPIYVLPNRSRCWSTERMSGGPPLKGAAVIGAIGIGMAIGGGAWLGVETRRYGSHTSRRERLLALGVGALAFTLGQAALIPVFIADQICHS